MIIDDPIKMASHESAEGADGDVWLTREEAARELHRSVRTVARMIKNGTLTKLPGGPGVRIPRKGIERIIQRPIHICAPTLPLMTLKVEQYVALRLEVESKEHLMKEMQNKLLSWEEERKVKEASAKIRSLRKELKKAQARCSQVRKVTTTDNLIKRLFARFFDQHNNEE